MGSNLWFQTSPVFMSAALAPRCLLWKTRAGVIDVNAVAGRKRQTERTKGDCFTGGNGGNRGVEWGRSRWVVYTDESGRNVEPQIGAHLRRLCRTEQRPQINESLPNLNPRKWAPICGYKFPRCSRVLPRLSLPSLCSCKKSPALAGQCLVSFGPASAPRRSPSPRRRLKSSSARP